MISGTIVAYEASTAAFDQELVSSIGHSVTVPGRSSTTTFRKPTRTGAALPGRVVSRRTSGLNSTPDAVISVVQLGVEADQLLGQTRVEPQAVVAHDQAHVGALDDVHRAGHRPQMDRLAGRPPWMSATSLSRLTLRRSQDRARSRRAKTQEWTRPDNVEPSEVRAG